MSNEKWEMDLLLEGHSSYHRLKSVPLWRDQSVLGSDFVKLRGMKMTATRVMYGLCMNISQRSNLAGVQQWLEANDNRVSEFLNWSKNYPWLSDG